MTKDALIADDNPQSPLRYFAHIVGWSLLLSIALIAFVILATSIRQLIGGGSSAHYALVAGSIPIIAASIYFLWRWLPDFTMGEPDTPRGNRVRWLLTGVVLVGVLTSIPLIAADDETSTLGILFGNGAVPPLTALLTVGVWGLCIPALIIFGRRNTDEHSLVSHDFGMMVGFHLFSWGTPIWWMGWRGGFLPEPDVMIIFAVTLIASGIANLWKRFA